MPFRSSAFMKKKNAEYPRHVKNMRHVKPNNIKDHLTKDFSFVITIPVKINKPDKRSALKSILTQLPKYMYKRKNSFEMRINYVQF
jgi:hypothetical protein